LLLRKFFYLLVAVSCLAPLAAMAEQNQILAQIKFDGSNKDEKTAGVWVDGQYVGFVKELKHEKKLLLLPGKHEILVKQAWYTDQRQAVMLDPGQVYTIKLEMRKDPVQTPEQAAQLKIVAFPVRAAVFIDEQFTGHVNEFNGPGQGILLTPGEHKVRIALPGYQPFETTVNLLPRQKMKVETHLMTGSITEAGALVSQQQGQPQRPQDKPSIF
jgi:PEGA domain